MATTTVAVPQHHFVALPLNIAELLLDHALCDLLFSDDVDLRDLTTWPDDVVFACKYIGRDAPESVAKCLSIATRLGPEEVMALMQQLAGWAPPLLVVEGGR